MKGLLLGGAALASLVACALDNTIKDDFWDTTAYVNARPSTLEVAVPGVVDTTVETDFASVPCGNFDSRKLGCLIMVR